MEDIINKMAFNFETEKLSLKVMEEMAELNEVLIKRVTKKGDMKPPEEKVVEEMGDLLFRMKILQRNMGIEHKVAERFRSKSQQISEWFTNEYEK